MRQKDNRTPGEKKIAKIGGRLSSDFQHLKQIIDIVNSDYIPLFQIAGMDKPEDKECIIDALISNYSFLTKARNAFIERYTKKVAEGEVKLEKILPKRTLSKKLPDPEAEEKRINREIHRNLCFKFNEIKAYYVKEYYFNTFSRLGYCKRPLELCRDTLDYTPSGLVIDADKFLKFYSSYIAADESEYKKQHQEAADGMNRFFGGAVEITSEELNKYFKLESGIVVPNPKSINIESYMRLGHRVAKVNKV